MNNQWHNDTCILVKRDNQGRFVEGDKEGKKFQKGSPGKPKGARKRKSILARQLAEVLNFNNQVKSTISKGIY